MLTASILFLFLPVKEVFKVTICNEVQIQNIQNERKQYSQFEKYMAQLDYKKDKIQFISQNTTGLITGTCAICLPQFNQEETGR